MRLQLKQPQTVRQNFVVFFVINLVVGCAFHFSDLKLAISDPLTHWLLIVVALVWWSVSALIWAAGWVAYFGKRHDTSD